MSQLNTGDQSPLSTGGSTADVRSDSIVPEHLTERVARFVGVEESHVAAAWRSDLAVSSRHRSVVYAADSSARASRSLKSVSIDRRKRSSAAGLWTPSRETDSSCSRPRATPTSATREASDQSSMSNDNSRWTAARSARSDLILGGGVSVVLIMRPLRSNVSQICHIVVSSGISECERRMKYLEGSFRLRRAVQHVLV